MHCSIVLSHTVRLSSATRTLDGSNDTSYEVIKSNFIMKNLDLEYIRNLYGAGVIYAREVRLLGEKLYKSGKFEDALECYEESLKHHNYCITKGKMGLTLINLYLDHPDLQKRFEGLQKALGYLKEADRNSKCEQAVKQFIPIITNLLALTAELIHKEPTYNIGAVDIRDESVVFLKAKCKICREPITIIKDVSISECKCKCAEARIYQWLDEINKL